MLETLITSKTRVRLLMKFFLNHRTTSYLRDLASEFGESTNAIRLELNKMEKAGLLNTKRQGNKKLFTANRDHPLFNGIHQLLLHHTGIDHVVDNVVRNLGGLHSAYVINSFAQGKDSRTIDMVLIGPDIDTDFLDNTIRKAEKIIERNITYRIVRPENTDDLLNKHPEALLLFSEPAANRESEEAKEKTTQ